MRLVSMDNYSPKDLVDFWNKNIGDDFPMTLELFMQNSINNQFVCEESSRIAINEKNEIAGMIIAKKNYNNSLLGTGNKIGWIQILLVDRNKRKQGIGTKLLNHVEEKFKQSGIEKIFLGRDPYHYFPGIPSNDLDTKEWFSNKEYMTIDTEYDMIKKYSNNEAIDIPMIEETEFLLATSSDKEELTQFMQKEFPGRWSFELNEYYNLGGQGREFTVVKKDGKIVGFCRINDNFSPVITSNISWSPLIDGELGGIGPLGVAANNRGNGYGIAVVEAGIAFLRERNIETIVIDWTGLVEFYKKLGYDTWKSYNSYSKNI